MTYMSGSIMPGIGLKKERYCIQYCSAYRERIAVSAPLSGGIKRCEKIALREIFCVWTLERPKMR